MGAKRFTLDTVERWCKIGLGTLMLPERKIVETEVDEGADLHIGNAMGAPEVGTFLIILGGTGDIAQLAVKPPQGVLQATEKEHVLHARVPWSCPRA